MKSHLLVVDGSARALIRVRWPVLSIAVERGHRVTAFAGVDRNMMDIQVDNVSEQFATRGVACHYWEVNRQGMNPLADLTAFLQMVRFIRTMRPDAVLAYSVKSTLYACTAAWLVGVPVIAAQLTGLGFLFEPGGGPADRVVKAVGRRFLKAALRRTTLVSFQNTDDQELLYRKGYISERSRSIVVNGSGVDLDEFPFTPPPTGKIQFLMIARVHRSKGVHEYLEAAKQVNMMGNWASFILVGPLDDHPSALNLTELQDLCRASGVTYLGGTSDVRQYLEKCSVFVLPSYREGLPRTVLEAMATGRAVITTDAPGCRSAIVAGLNGLIVPVRNAEALANAMLQFIQRPEMVQNMGQASRTLAEEKFAARAVGEALSDAMGLY